MTKNRPADPSETCALDLNDEFHDLPSQRLQRLSALIAIFSNSPPTDGRHQSEAALWRIKALRGWESRPVLSDCRYEVRLSRLPAVSIVFTSLAAGRGMRRISVGGLP